MPLYYGNTQVKELYYNNTKVKEMYYNNTKVWSAIPLSGTLAVGNIVTFDNKVWRVVHNDNNLWYLGLETISTKVVYANSEYTTYYYSESNLRQTCINYLNEFSSEAQAIMQPVRIQATLTDVSDKVFIPTRQMVLRDLVNTAFSYYNSNDRRIAKDASGNPITWWLSSGVSGADEVQKLGQISKVDNPYYMTSGFRPHICIQV